VSPTSQLYIKSGRTLSFPIRFYPVVEISLEGYRMSGICSSLVIHVNETGLLSHFICTEFSLRSRYKNSLR